MDADRRRLIRLRKAYGATGREGKPGFTTETQRARRKILFEFGFQTLRTLCLCGEIWISFAACRAVGFAEADLFACIRG